MTKHEVFQTLVNAGIDPAKAFPRLAMVQNPFLRAPTKDEIVIILAFLTKGSLVNQGIIGTVASPMAPVFEGWNVWAVWQVRDLPFSLLMIGVSRDRQLQIWVEDHVRLEASEAKVADPIDLKGSQIQILPGEPSGLKEAKRKEQVPEPIVLESQDLPPELRFVRFFNRGSASQLPWPHDDAYLLEKVYQPDPGNQVTKGPGPGTITDRNVTEPVVELSKNVLIGTVGVAAIGLLVYGAFLAIESQRSK